MMSLASGITAADVARRIMPLITGEGPKEAVPGVLVTAATSHFAADAVASDAGERTSAIGAVLAKIRSGEVVRHQVTIPEGVTSDMAVEILAANPVLSGDAPTPPEGAILPETYDVQRGEDRAAVLRRLSRRRVLVRGVAGLLAVRAWGRVCLVHAPVRAWRGCGRGPARHGVVLLRQRD